jgi:hypothetical protein
MMHRTLLLCLFAAASQLIGSSTLQLQVRVLDPSQAAVKGARVYLTDGHQRTVFSGETNKAGEITISLVPGSYQLRCQQDGFEEQTTAVIMAQANRPITIVLPLARQTTSITVSESSPHLDTATDAHQDELRLGPNDLGNLPVRDGDVLSALTFFTNPAGGQSPTLIVDGMERTDSVSLTPSQIQEGRINSNAYSAEFPKPGKDRIEIDTKAGSDALHGGLFFRTRNSIFDARNPLAPSNPPYSRYGYGFDLGGPILKKKLFFFLSADREEQQQVAPVLAFLPSGVLQQDALAPFTSNLLMGKLDWQMTTSNRLSAKYELHEDTANNAGVGGFVLPEAAATQFHHDNRIEISDQYIVSLNVLNNFQMALGTNYRQTQSVTVAHSVIAAGAFAEGGAQLDDWSREPRYEFQDTLGRVKGATTIRFGVDAKFHPFSTFNADNFGGTYQYASLAAYDAAQPLLFTLNAGNPLVISEQDDYAWFLQTERQFRRLTLFAGVRHEFQSHLDRHANLAPRLAAAWALDQDRKTILRLGAGVFYDRRPPIILQQVDRFNGINEVQFIIENPPLPVVNPEQLVPPQMTTVYQIDPTMTLPRTYLASATLERQLTGGFVATADYTFEQGNHLLRTRNINAPMPVTLVRPDPDRGNVDQIESSASSRGNILNITVKSSASKRYQFFAQYTLSYLRDDTDDVFGPPPPGGVGMPGAGAISNLFALPVDNYDLRPEWGPADNDIRHRLGVAAIVHLPRKFNLGTLTSLHTGLPYDITTGEDNNHDTDPNDRPPGVTRNTGRGGGFFSVDLHLGRTLSFERGGRSFQCEIAADSFNVLNHFNPSSYVGVITSPLFGQPNAAYNGRQMQFSLNVHF